MMERVYLFGAWVMSLIALINVIMRTKRKDRGEAAVLSVSDVVFYALAITLWPVTAVLMVNVWFQKRKRQRSGGGI